MLGGGTDSFGASVGGRVGVSAQRGDELGHLLVALDPAERALGVEHAGSGPAQHHLPVAPAGDVAVGGARDRDHRLGLDVVSVLARAPVMPSRATVNSSGRPSRRLAAAPGCLRSNMVARALASRSPAAASGLFSARTSFASTQPRSVSGRCSATFRLLWTVQRWIAALAPKTAVTAADSAFAPSMTTSSPSSASSPRATRSANR